MALSNYYPQLVHLQDLLGEIHDASQALKAMKRERRLWRDLHKSRRWKECGFSRFGLRRLLAGQAAVRRAYEDEADRARTEFRDVWPGFAGKSFRLPVDELLTRLARLPAGGASPPHSSAQAPIVTAESNQPLPVEQVAASVVFAAGFAGTRETSSGSSATPGEAR
ncbi:MAG: hypothetical protein EXS05_19920 [Planctomycetaceae bacterium]|nr:hypothetical protein [Planctomycetaceae bacterium]